MITDTHCHLSCDELYPKADELIQHALDEGVDLMMVMATNKEEYLRALELKKRYPDHLRVAFGWFPSDALSITDEDLAYIEEEAKSGRMDVLGEIGLDYHWDTSFKEEQKKLFAAQLDIAARSEIPVAIHMRDASRDTMDLLWEHAKTPIIFHCFSGSLPILEEALKMNSMISFAGPITYKNNKQGPINVKACPPERMLSETDSPYLSPVPFRGKENQPAYVKATVEKLAELKEMDPDQLNTQIRSNFKRLLGEEQPAL